jgi:hypothetical protein
MEHQCSDYMKRIKNQEQKTHCSATPSREPAHAILVSITQAGERGPNTYRPGRSGELWLNQAVSMRQEIALI